MGTQRGLSNMDILEKSSKDLLYDKSNGCGKEFTQLCVVIELLKLKASKITSKAEYIAHKHLRGEEAYMSDVLRCGQNTRMSQPLYFVPQIV
jgi:hypothetical protein